MVASGRRRLQSDPKTPPPNRLPPIHPRPRGTGTLGAPTSSSAHGSPPPDRLHCVLPDGPTRSLISASEGKCAASESLQFGSLCPLVTGWTEARVTWLRVGADDYNPTPKLHPQIGYRRFTPAHGGQVPWERRRPRRHTAQLRPRGTGTLGAPTSSSAHGSAPPAGDRYRGSADVLVGTRLSSA
jgi:hypothetical protein